MCEEGGERAALGLFHIIIKDLLLPARVSMAALENEKEKIGDLNLVSRSCVVAEDTVLESFLIKKKKGVGHLSCV